MGIFWFSVFGFRRKPVPVKVTCRNYGEFIGRAVPTGALMVRPGVALSYLDEICRILFSSIPSAGRVIESMFDIFTHRMAKRK
jgi:hypothetical protein